MGTTGIILTAVIIIIAVLLILVILIQNSKGGGISSSVGISNQIMGVQRSTENVEKITWVLVSLLAVICIVYGFTDTRKTVDVGPKDTGYNYPMTSFEISTPPTVPQTDQNGSTNT